MPRRPSSGGGRRPHARHHSKRNERGDLLTDREATAGGLSHRSKARADLLSTAELAVLSKFAGSGGKLKAAGSHRSTAVYHNVNVKVVSPHALRCRLMP